jgi:hypothetical protein
VSDTPKRGKLPGYDFWSRRPGGGCYGRVAKWITRRLERSAKRKLVATFDGENVDESLAPRHEPIGGRP